MIALILAAGRGKRINAITDSGNKCLLQFRGIPLIEYHLQRFANLESILEIVIVVGFRAQDIINKFGTHYHNKKITYVFQESQMGLVNAIKCSNNKIVDTDFFLVLGDEHLVKPDISGMIDYYFSSNSFGVCGIVLPSDLEQTHKTYALETDPTNPNKIIKLIEKPLFLINNMQGTGHCIFNNKIFDYIDITPINPNRGEKELPDLIQVAIDNGHLISKYIISEKYVNVNTPSDFDLLERTYHNEKI